MGKFAIETILCPSHVCADKRNVCICNICGKMNYKSDYFWMYAHFMGDCIISPYINEENDFSSQMRWKYDKLVINNSKCLICNDVISSPKQRISHAKKCIRRLKGDDGGFPPNKLPFNTLDIISPPGSHFSCVRCCGYCGRKQYKCDICPGYAAHVKNHHYGVVCCPDYRKKLLESAFNAKLFEKTGYNSGMWYSDEPPTAPSKDFYYVMYGCCIYCHEELEPYSWQGHMRVCPGYTTRFAEFKQK